MIVITLVAQKNKGIEILITQENGEECFIPTSFHLFKKNYNNFRFSSYQISENGSFELWKYIRQVS